MKINRLYGAHGFRGALAWLGTGLLLCGPGAAWAATDVEVWHTLNAHNADVFKDLVDDFNDSQKDIKVKLKSFTSESDLQAKLLAIKKAADRPQLVQLDDERTPEKLAHADDIVPLYKLLNKHPIKDAKWFLSDKNTFARDSRGRLIAFPYMADIPVMYYNVGAFKKAGLANAVPDRAWSGLQAQLVTLANNGSRNCPLTSDQPVSVNLENLAAVNNQLYASNENGLKGKGDPAFTFDVMYIRHLSMMISWVRSELMVRPEFDSVATKRFANDECAVLMSSSSNIGWFKDTRKLDFGVSGLPYYPQVTGKPGNPFVGGAALWLMAGHPDKSDAASLAFLNWLAQPKHAARWYQETGFLPLTDQAFGLTGENYYDKLGNWRQLVAAQQSTPTANGRGFRIDNYPAIRAMFRRTLDRALDGKEPAVTALKTASAEASRLMRQK